MNLFKGAKKKKSNHNIILCFVVATWCPTALINITVRLWLTGQNARLALSSTLHSAADNYKLVPNCLRRWKGQRDVFISGWEQLLWSCRHFPECNRAESLNRFTTVWLKGLFKKRPHNLTSTERQCTDNKHSNTKQFSLSGSTLHSDCGETALASVADCDFIWITMTQKPF